MTLFSNIRSVLALAVVTAGAMSLFAAGAVQASPVGHAFNVSFNNL